MAQRTDLEQLVYQMSADVRQLERAQERAIGVVNRSATQIQGRMDRLSSDMTRSFQRTEVATSALFAGMGDSIRRELLTLAGPLAAMFSAQQVLAYADGWNRARNQLAAAGVATGVLSDRQDELADAANRTYSEFDGTVRLYTRLTMATERLGYSHERVLRLTELVNMSFAAGGASAQEAAAGVLQLSQALGSGFLQGDELRSIRENAPLIARAIADAMGVSVGELKKLGAEGRITAQVVSDAIMAAGDDIEARFAAMTPTVAQSLTVLNNELGRYVASTDESLSATERMAQGIILLANNLDVVVTTAGLAVAIVGTRMTVAFVLATASAINYQAALLSGTAATLGVSRASLLASASVSALGAAFRFLFTNPIGIAITAISTALALLAMRGDRASDSEQELAASVDRTDKALRQYRLAAEAAAQATGENAAEARRNAEAMRVEAVAAVRAALALRYRTAALRDQTAAAAEDAATRVRTAVGQAQTPLAQGEYARLRGIAEQAREDADAAREAAGHALKDLYNIDNPLPTPTVTGTGDDDEDGRGRRASGPSPEELAARRDMIRLEQALEIARASNNEREVDRLQNRIDLIRITREMEEAGFADAAAQAEAFIAARNQAVAAAEEEARLAELRRQSERMREEAQERATRWAERQLQVQIELARATGDDRALARLEREAELRQRIAEYVERFGLAGAGLAVAEQTQFDLARDEAETRDEARAMARTFVDIVAADNAWEEIGRRFRNAAFDHLENLLTELFTALRNSGQNGGQGGGGIGAVISSVLSWFSGGKSGAKFGGTFATGGHLGAGQWGIAGEKGPEVIFGGTTGLTVFPNRSGEPGSDPVAANAGEPFPRAAASATASRPVVRVEAPANDEGVETLAGVMDQFFAVMRAERLRAANDDYGPVVSAMLRRLSDVARSDSAAQDPSRRSWGMADARWPEVSLGGQSGRSVASNRSVAGAQAAPQAAPRGDVHHTWIVHAEGAVLAEELVDKLEARGAEMSATAGFAAYSQARQDIADEMSTTAQNRLGVR